MAMVGGSFEVPRLMASWPEGEFGPMGLEGAVQLGYKQELAATPEGPERDALFNSLLAEMIDKGQATEVASLLELDAVIDPAATRDTIAAALDY
jgi:acetyl-CoA carboxylase carboxyltransferase component